jgi:hypothetical protein
VTVAALYASCQGAVADLPAHGAPPAQTAAAARASTSLASFDRMPVVRPRYVVPDRPHLLTYFDGSRTLFPGHRVVAFYGAAGAPGLGVLGTGSPDGVWPRLLRQARPYRTHRSAVMPGYELITFVATGSRGNQGNFSTRVSDATIARYARAAKRHHAMLVLDIQPGRGNFLPDARSLKRWLQLPYVALGLDPEWKLYPGERPLSRIGHTDGRTINRVSRWLNRFTRTHHLPQKLLLVHEFTESMVLHKRAVVTRRHLALVFNVDGFGSRAAKRGKYHDFATDRRFPLGFKLFYDADIAMLSPADVLHMHPRPVVVEYE